LLVVGDQHFGRQAAQFAIELLHRQIETVADVDAQAGTRAGQRGDEADLDRVGGVGGAG
jgi:phage FluMu protein gp41